MDSVLQINKQNTGNNGRIRGIYMIYDNKADFLAALKNELSKYGVNDSEITEDFEQHFTIGLSQGQTEAQVCEKLGDPAEIARQYAPDFSGEFAQGGAPDTSGVTQSGSAAGCSGFDAPPPYTYNNMQDFSPCEPQEMPCKASAGKIAGILCLDIFVYSWTIPALVALVISYWAVMIAFFFSFFGILLGTACSGSLFGYEFFVSVLTPAANIFAAIAALGFGMLMCAFCLDVWKGIWKILKGIGRAHRKAFTGKD